MEFRILVSGSRKGMPSEVYDEVLEMIPYHENYVLIHGNASGVDKQFAQIVAKQGWGIESCPADWSLGKKAGPLRNQVMVDSGIDFGIFLPIEDSIGTYDCLNRYITKYPQGHYLIYDVQSKTIKMK